MADERMRVVNLIREAFRDVKLGAGVGLMEAQGLDDYADEKTLAEYRRGDEKDAWAAIPVSELDRCESSLSFFDAEGMRFHLPAFLIASLQGRLSSAQVDFHLRYVGHGNLSRFDLLSDSQRDAVREYLLFEVADEPLGDYWADRRL